MNDWTNEYMIKGMKWMIEWIHEQEQQKRMWEAISRVVLLVESSTSWQTNKQTNKQTTLITIKYCCLLMSRQQHSKTHRQGSCDFQGPCHHGIVLLLHQVLFGLIQIIPGQQSQNNGHDGQNKDKDDSSHNDRRTSGGGGLARLGGIFRLSRRGGIPRRVAAGDSLARLVCRSGALLGYLNVFPEPSHDCDDVF